MEKHRFKINWKGTYHVEDTQLQCSILSSCKINYTALRSQPSQPWSHLELELEHIGPPACRILTLWDISYRTILDCSAGQGIRTVA
jgi:hypothetical protein